MKLKASEYLRRLYKLLFPQLVDYLSSELEDAESILDIGCGNNSPLNHIPNRCHLYVVGIDLFLRYIRESRRKSIHDEYVLADITQMPIRQKSFDCVLALDVLEHLTKQQGYELIRNMERIARREVIILTPNGYQMQSEYDQNPLQVHRSGWTADELRHMGYDVRGIDGLKLLRGERSKLRFYPTVVFQLFSDLTQKITFYLPKMAFSLYARKENVYYK